ncbi:MAG: glycosyltransferase family 2 protein [Blastocatellia bacterium]|nr:glycosyltransferase family 2 protein [Blastocatellia bacterium]
MSLNYSVIICSHNPRRDYLQRTLTALRAQTLPDDRWELLLIDNASTECLAHSWDLSWHPGSRHVREDELGLTPARLRGIREAGGEMLVFVDDDNVLASDFLERIETIAEGHPYLGVFGSGAVEPEFEVQLPPELVHLATQHGGVLPLLALKSVPYPFWSNNPLDRSSMPWGAGLCVRRDTAARYVELIRRLDVNEILDRRGKELFCSGDDLFSWAASRMGKGFGVFPELRVVHLISAERLTTNYFLRLVYGWWLSESVLNYLMMGIEPRRFSLERKARMLLSGARSGVFEMRYKVAGARGQEQGRRMIVDNRLQPLGTVRWTGVSSVEDAAFESR